MSRAYKLLNRVLDAVTRKGIFDTASMDLRRASDSKHLNVLNEVCTEENARLK